MPLKKPEQSSSFTDDCASSWCCLPFFSLFKRKKTSQLSASGYAPAAARQYKQVDLTLSTLSEPLLAGDIGSSTEPDHPRLKNSTF